MRKSAFVFAILGIVLGLAGAAPSRAQTSHGYVSATGSDVGTCDFGSPCHSLQYAVNAASDGGEVSCLDSGFFFYAVSISNSVTIDCPGVPAEAWYITISGSNIVVTLRHLTVTDLSNSVQSPSGGIYFESGAALFVENCVIENWNRNSGIGIKFAPSAGTAKLFVTDSVIKNNGSANAGAGLYIQPASGAEADVTVERTKFESNRIGIYANSGSGGIIHGVVRDSVVSGNAMWGIGALNAGARLLVENTSVTANKIGLVAENSASMLVSHSSVVLNTRGLYESTGGTLSSYKNNNVNDNTADGAFTATLAQK